MRFINCIYFNHKYSLVVSLQQSNATCSKDFVLTYKLPDSSLHVCTFSVIKSWKAIQTYCTFSMQKFSVASIASLERTNNTSAKMAALGRVFYRLSGIFQYIVFTAVI